MLVKLARIGFCFALILGFSAVWEEDCRAASMYAVTDLGSWSAATNPHPSEVVVLHPMLGMSLTDAEQAALPWVHGIPAAGGPPLTFSAQLDPYQNTASGIVLGTVPLGLDRGEPWGNRVYVASQKQADGTFSPVVELAVQFGPHGDSREDSFASLDAQGNLLLTNRYVQQLIDMNTGTRTDLATLLPPGTLNRPGFSSTIGITKMAADGTIFAQITSNDFADGPGTHLFQMTPVPEPSTLATFAVLVAGLAVVRRRSKNRVEPSSLTTSAG